MSKKLKTGSFNTGLPYIAEIRVVIALQHQEFKMPTCIENVEKSNLSLTILGQSIRL